jgi:toxin ParE1/3/4
VRALLYADQAKADLREIKRGSTEQWGVERTRRYMDDISRRARALRQTPLMGRVREEIGARARSIVSGRHVIFYEVHPEFILVTAVVHGSMDLEARLSGDT